MKSLGDAIKSGRLKRNMTQQELAEGICTQATISNIEKAGKLPAINLLLAIADRLDIEIEEFYAAAMAMINKNNEMSKTISSDMELYKVPHFMY